jgi:hypothetical protein
LAAVALANIAVVIKYYARFLFAEAWCKLLELFLQALVYFSKVERPQLLLAQFLD